MRHRLCAARLVRAGVEEHGNNGSAFPDALWEGAGRPLICFPALGLGQDRQQHARATARCAWPSGAWGGVGAKLRTHLCVKQCQARLGHIELSWLECLGLGTLEDSLQVGLYLITAPSGQLGHKLLIAQAVDWLNLLSPHQSPGRETVEVLNHSDGKLNLEWALGRALLQIPPSFCAIVAVVPQVVAAENLDSLSLLLRIVMDSLLLLTAAHAAIWLHKIIDAPIHALAIMRF